MNGSPKTLTKRGAILEALKQPPNTGYFVWNGVDEDERPATVEELQKGVEAYRKKRGRLISAIRKKRVSVRYSPEVLSYFRSTGEGWQARMDAALRLLVKKHPDWLKNLG